jgi:hypothetical protein
MAQIELTQSYVTYQAQTKLLELAKEIAEARLIKGELVGKYNLAVKIRMWLKALSYSAYLDKPTIDKLVLCLSQLCDANALPYAPVITSIEAPTLSIGGSRTTNNITYAAGTTFQNLDVDTSTEVVDSFAVSLSNGAVWEYLIINSGGTALRKGTFSTGWLSDGSEIADGSDVSCAEIGDTSDVVLSVDISGGNVRLKATAASDNWIVKGTRYLDY